MDAAYELSKFVVSTKFDDLPSEVVQIVKKDVLDILGNALGGSRDSAVEAIHEMVKEWGGKEESTVINFGTKLPSLHAALINSVMAFALDFDDTHERGRLHAGVAAVPTAFAVSELKGEMTGKEFITALCTGMEVACRLGIASERRIPTHIMGGWDYAALHGCFSSAIAAGKLLNLNEHETHNALGIAYHQASGNGLSAIDEADTKKLGPGFASKAGIISALLARKGVTGAKAIFEDNEMSLSRLYHSGCDRAHLLAGLGSDFEISDINFKPYPCCRLGHRYIDAVLDLINENSLRPSEIEEITTSVCAEVHGQLCVPIEGKRKPANKTAAQFSLPWVLGSAVVRGKVGIHEFDEESLHDSAVLNVASRVNPVLDSSLPDWQAFASVKIRTSRGTFVKKTTYPYGSIQNPMNIEDLKNKFLDCASFSRKHISKANLTEVISMVENLEELKDVGGIIKVLQ